MRSNEADGRDGKRRTAVSARVEVHPTANAAARQLMQAMTAEFDRWMADEVEELAESVSIAAGSTESPHVRTYLRHLAERLARQAELLGYPDIVEAAHRLGRQFDGDAPELATDTARLDRSIAELRSLLKR